MRAKDAMTTECGAYVTCRECDRDGEARCGLPYEHEGDHVPRTDVRIARLEAVVVAARAHVSAVIEQGAPGGQSLLTLEEALANLDAQ